MRFAREITWFATLALICRASAADPARPPAPPAPPTQFEHDMLLRFHMHENYDLARATERLLLRGKLDEAKALAAGIASAPDEPGDPRWATHALRVREAAAQFARAVSIPDACRRDAALATACAGCHVELGVAPEFATHPAPPPDKPTVDARMLRHQWAAARLWEGIIGGAREPWSAGLEVLAAAPLPDDQIARRQDLAQKLQRLADQARRGKAGPDEHTYGEILATCAACHVAVARP